MRSAYEIGPPLASESISFFASSNKLKATARFLFSGLLISELQKEKHKKGKIKVVIRSMFMKSIKLDQHQIGGKRVQNVFTKKSHVASLQNYF